MSHKRKRPSRNPADPYRATMPEAFPWTSQERQYPRVGPPGISYFAGPVPEWGEVHCLLWRDDEGLLRGILNYYDKDMPPWEKAGNVNVFVDPAWRRKGIATQLCMEATSRFPIRLEGQRFTKEGAELARALARVMKQREREQ
jgi:GNAT superfamily N-acetyltransferase